MHLLIIIILIYGNTFTSSDVGVGQTVVSNIRRISNEKRKESNGRYQGVNDAQRQTDDRIEKPKRTLRQVTAYVSYEQFTDSSPCIGAFGDNLCKMYQLYPKRKVCASNGYPRGTKLDIEGYGECVVMDRMNSRYTNGEVDIYMGYDLEGARQFGVKYLEVIKL